MKAYQTITVKPCGKVSHAYVITAKSKEEAERAAKALAEIHACKVTIK